MKITPEKGRLMQKKTLAAVSLLAAFALTVTACSGDSPAPTETTPTEEVPFGISDADYTLEKLIEAAKLEGPITVTDGTGKIVEMAEKFTAKYGIEAIGVKMTVQEQQDVLIAEQRANNVQTDVFSTADVSTAVAELLPQGYVVSWVPKDLAADIDPRDQSPVLVVVQSGLVWAYNTEIHGDTCPVDNIWDLTDPEWSGHVGIQDPTLLSEILFMFNQWETHSDDLIKAAYKDYSGSDLNTSEKSATAEWVKRFAANNPLVTQTDGEIAEAVGAPGQSESFIGFVTTSKFRDNEAKGLKLGLCDTLRPWVGHWTPKVGLIASGTKSPNASKLFVHFMLTEEGMAPQLDDGKMSTNKSVPMYADASGIEKVVDLVHTPNPSTADQDFFNRLDWEDFWRSNNR